MCTQVFGQKVSSVHGVSDVKIFWDGFFFYFILFQRRKLTMEVL